MKTRFLIILIALSGLAHGQGTWTQKANFGGTARWEGIGFSIGNKGYIGTGQDGSYRNDLWEYDPIADSWTQRASLPATGRHSACCFTLGTKLYAGTGFTPATISDFWEWDQTTNTWLQKANYGPGIRDDCFTFSLSGKGYVGTGSIWNSQLWFNDFWEYDPSSNSWSQKANFPGGNRAEVVAFTIGNLGYAGTGSNGSARYNDFWEYDPLNNSWTAKANFPGTARHKASGFSIGTKGYIGIGNDGANNLDFWEWDQTTDVWVQQANFSGGLRMDASSFSIGCKGYLGTGSNGSPSFKDFWEFIPSGGASAVITSSGTSICSGQSVTLSASGGTDFLWNNGSTATQIIVSPTANASYSVTVSASCGSSTASVSISVNSPVSAVVSGNATICSGLGVTLSASGGTNYSWNTGATGSSISIAPSSSSSYSVIVSLGNCSDTASSSVSVLSTPTVSITGSTTLCMGSSISLSASGGGSYSWSTGQTASSITVSPTSVASYSVLVTDANGCSTNASTMVTVFSMPVAAITGNTTICSGQSSTLVASGGTNYSWSNGSTGNSIIVSPSSFATFSVVVTNAPCSHSAGASVTVLPNPSALVSANVTITQGESTILSASGGGSYLWSNGSTDSIVTVAPAGTFTYCVAVTDSNNCTGTSCIIISVEDIVCSALYVPSAFSPNADEENDIFKADINNTDCLTFFSLFIYNRWGEMVYEGSDITQGWNGTYRGQREATGVFVYYLKAEFISGNKIERKGNISLIR